MTLAVPGAYLIPPELSLLLQGPSGRVLTFGINLKDIFSAVRDSGKLSLVRHLLIYLFFEWTRFAARRSRRPQVASSGFRSPSEYVKGEALSISV